MRQGVLALLLFFYAAVVVADGKALTIKPVCNVMRHWWGGSGNAVYNKLESRITSFKRLQGQVASCVLAADVMWLPEEQR